MQYSSVSHLAKGDACCRMSIISEWFHYPFLQDAAYFPECPVSILSNYSLRLMYQCCRHPTLLWGILTMDTKLVPPEIFGLQSLLIYLEVGCLCMPRSQEQRILLNMVLFPHHLSSVLSSLISICIQLLKCTFHQWNFLEILW